MHLSKPHRICSIKDEPKCILVKIISFSTLGIGWDADSDKRMYNCITDETTSLMEIVGKIVDLSNSGSQRHL